MEVPPNALPQHPSPRRRAIQTSPRRRRRKLPFQRLQRLQRLVRRVGERRHARRLGSGELARSPRGTRDDRPTRRVVMFGRRAGEPPRAGEHPRRDRPRAKLRRDGDAAVRGYEENLRGAQPAGVVVGGKKRAIRRERRDERRGRQHRRRNVNRGCAMRAQRRRRDAEARAEVRAGYDVAVRPDPKPEPAVGESVPAEKTAKPAEPPGRRPARRRAVHPVVPPQRDAQERQVGERVDRPGDERVGNLRGRSRWSVGGSTGSPISTRVPRRRRRRRHRVHHDEGAHRGHRDAKGSRPTRDKVVRPGERAGDGVKDENLARDGDAISRQAPRLRSGAPRGDDGVKQPGEARRRDRHVRGVERRGGRRGGVRGGDGDVGGAEGVRVGVGGSERAHGSAAEAEERRELAPIETRQRGEGAGALSLERVGLVRALVRLSDVCRTRSVGRDLSVCRRPSDEIQRDVEAPCARDVRR